MVICLHLYGNFVFASFFYIIFKLLQASFKKIDFVVFASPLKRHVDIIEFIFLKFLLLLLTAEYISSLTLPHDSKENVGQINLMLA